MFKELEDHLRGIRAKLMDEYESKTDYIHAEFRKREIRGIDHALSFISKNKLKNEENTTMLPIIGGNESNGLLGKRSDCGAAR